MTDTIPVSVIDTLIDDLISNTENGLSVWHEYAAHPDNSNAVIVKAYEPSGEIAGRYTVTFQVVEATEKVE